MCVLAVDALSAAVQPSGEAPTAEMVHGSQRSGQEEDHTWRHTNGAGSTPEGLQLPAVEGSEDRLQEVRGHLLISCSFFVITMLSVTFQLGLSLSHSLSPLSPVNDQPLSLKAPRCVYRQIEFLVKQVFAHD